MSKSTTKPAVSAAASRPGAGEKHAPPPPKPLDWPNPPFHEPQDDHPPAQEPAYAVLRDERTVIGNLTGFDAPAGLIELAGDDGTTVTIASQDLLELRLTRPLKLRRRRSVLEERAENLDVPAESQKFQVVLINDRVIEGETAGFDMHSHGLFLFVRANGEGILRTFIPAEAIKHKQIGSRLGDLLVSENRLSPTQVDAAIEQQHARRSQKLGEFLTREQIISRGDLAAAIERLRSRPVMRLGEALLAMRRISVDQLDQALARQKENRGKPLGQILVEQGLITREELKRTLTQQLGIPFVDLSRFEPEGAATKIVPAAVAAEFNVLPLCFDGRALVLAVENPLDPGPLDKIRFLTGLPVAPVMADGTELRAAVRLHYGVTEAPTVKIEDLAAELDITATPQDVAEEELVRETDSVLVRLVNKMVLDAHEAKASDIHIESYPGRSPVRVRFRKDGALQEYLSLPATYRSALLSRIKIMASLDISEKRRAQDGKIQFQNFGPAKLELRLATIPTSEGLEDAVLRLLHGGAAPGLDKLGLREDVLTRLKKQVERPYGILLVCGPTGSGKTTTLHSLLAHINTPDCKIWTAEDPVEIQQPGLRQVQVNAKIGWTFAAAMRSFLRADPDVIMVGEMRDAETARIGVEASLTGHLVFSTLHTNSAPESVVRLLDMGVQPFNFADSLLGILAQRLVRRLCAKCKTSKKLSDQEILELSEEYCADTSLAPEKIAAEWRKRYGGAPMLSQAPGCDSCGKSGYAGRLGIHELLVNSPRIRPLIHRSAGVEELRAAAIAEGMRTLRQDGIEKCFDGLTDVHEVRAATA